MSRSNNTRKKVLTSPLMRKGGAHVKTKKAVRKQYKDRLKTGRDEEME